MRPYLLLHEKPLTEIKFNTEGDLLFTSTKEKGGPITAWWSDNGERAGTYDGHSGAVYSIDVNRTTTRLLSGAADQTARLWDIETGKEIAVFPHTDANVVKCVSFALGDRQFMTITDPSSTQPSCINIFKVTEDSRDQRANTKSIKQLQGPTSRLSKGIWGWRNETIITTGADGYVRVFNVERGKEVQQIKLHDKEIIDLQYDKFRGNFLTASKDGYAKLVDARTMEIQKVYDTGRPLNAAAISPLMDHIIVGGGEEAVRAALTQASSEQFKVRFFHSIFGEELGSILGHFGPVNVLTFSPDGRSFASGGEDGFVRLHFMDDNYFSRTSEVSQY